jgi:hypothetical protein
MPGIATALTPPLRREGRRLLQTGEVVEVEKRQVSLCVATRSGVAVIDMESVKVIDDIGVGFKAALSAFCRR